jgi:uncharacterized protein (DUF983 family)
VPDFEFTCPNCGERMLVDEETRVLLRDEGCAVCGDPPGGEAFAPTGTDE